MEIDDLVTQMIYSRLALVTVEPGQIHSVTKYGAHEKYRKYIITKK